MPDVMRPLRELPGFDVRKYGAVGDGKTLCTAAFTAAIAAAHAAAGGGRVVVADGHYLIGGIHLLSGVYLDVDADAVVLASNVEDDYPYAMDQWAVIASVNQSNVGIIGAGVIDGQAVPLWVAGWSGLNNRFLTRAWKAHAHPCGLECRPRLVQFVGCENVTIAWVTLQNSPDWTSHYQGCKNLHIDSIHSLGDSRWPNNDACDPDASVNIFITNSVFDTGDDGLCPKATVGFGPLRNLTATNMWIRSKSCAIKFGSNTDTEMHDILFENVTIVDSNRGLGIQQRGQGNVHNVTYRNITIETRYEAFPAWWGAGEPIWISTEARTKDQTIGRTYDIHFYDITAKSENGAMVSGRYHPVDDVTFDNVHITIDAWTNYSNPVHDYRPAWFNPSWIYADTDGIYAENVTDFAIRDSSVTFVAAHAKPYWGTCLNATAADGNSGVTTSNFKCTPPPPHA